jgi:hypothetical protein
MRKFIYTFFTLLTLTMFTTACNNNAFEEDYTQSTTDNTDSVLVTFNCILNGFTLDSFKDETQTATRGNVFNTMTNLYVLDYNNSTNQLLQNKYFTLTNSQGVQLYLAKNKTHKLYFVASNGDNPLLNTNEYSIKWKRVGDTFHTTTIVSTNNNPTTLSVTLNRVTAKVRFNVVDKVPNNANTFTFEPTKWYCGINYTTGIPMYETTDITTLQIPKDKLNTQAQLTFDLYTISISEEWKTNAEIKTYNTNNTVIGKATVNNIPLQKNKITTYRGNLFNEDNDSNNDDTTTGISHIFFIQAEGTWNTMNPYSLTW